MRSGPASGEKAEMKYKHGGVQLITLKSHAIPPFPAPALLNLRYMILRPSPSFLPSIS